MSSLVGQTSHQGSGVVSQSPKDSVIAIHYAVPNQKGSVVNESWNFAFVTGTRKSGTSKFLCSVTITYGQYTNAANTDPSNPVFRWRYVFNNSSGTPATTDIAGTYGSSGWYSSDVPTMNRTSLIYNGAYDTTQMTSQSQIINPPKGHAGDAFEIKQLITAGPDGFYLGRCRANSGHGSLGGMICYEIETSQHI